VASVCRALGLSADVGRRILAAEQDLFAWSDFYAGLGLKVLPRRRGSKHPGIEWKPYQKRHPTDDERRAWFTDVSVTGICGVLDGTGYVVLELDAAAPDRLPDAYTLLARAGIAIPAACPRVLSGSGRSAQFWFRGTQDIPGRYIAAVTHPDGTAKQGGAQLDILGRGIVVLPPTLHHATGKPYHWWPPFLTRERVPELC
jgi:hypothetical protein